MKTNGKPILLKSMKKLKKGAIINIIQTKMEDKFILDVCCGGRCFWFDKQHPNTLYIDNRVREKGHSDDRFNHCIKPDRVMDFRNLEYKDKTFKMIIMDPPHLIGKPDGCRMTKKYGSWNKDTWRKELKQGFEEAWRVLEDYGVLIFKWNEASIKKKDVLEVLEKEPLIGHPVQSKIPTHWFVFMKIPEKRSGNTYYDN